mgnify:CR=1 FL=1|tara:strand:- start:6339 stop:6533 length:195 start_codon:yes stop_codon:yes gene_type:complete
MFEIKKSKYGLYTSYKEDGTPMVTGLTSEGVDYVTREIHIPVLEGTFDGYTSVPFKGTVDGKLT